MSLNYDDIKYCPGFDHYYAKVDGEWVRFTERFVDDRWECLPPEEIPDLGSDFWVDICHGGNLAIDDRYYFPDLASALDFYLEGWKERQYLDKDGKEMGIDHSGLYSHGQLILGESQFGDAPGHDGENLHRILGEVAKKLGEQGEI